MPPAPAQSRRSIWIAAISLLAAGAAGYWLWLRPQPVSSRFTRGANQNVPRIRIDTLRADALGSYGVPFAFAHAPAVASVVESV